MSGESGPGNELVRINDRRDLAPRAEAMDLPTAQRVLQTVVGTREDSITDISSLDNIGEYTIPQVRQAFELMATNLMDTHGGEERFGATSKGKETPYGKARLTVFQKLNKKYKPLHPQSLYLSVTKGGNFVLESELPLKDDDSDIGATFIRYSDFRSGTNVTTAYDLQKEFSIEKYRQIWRGARWLAANVLAWDRKGLVMPEELDVIEYDLPQLPEGESKEVFIDVSASSSV